MFRSLTNEEIATLERQGCTCADWSGIEVSAAFSPANIRNVEFSGKIRLGKLDGNFYLPGGTVRKSSI